jgi:hypothetical protein
MADLLADAMTEAGMGQLGSQTEAAKPVTGKGKQKPKQKGVSAEHYASGQKIERSDEEPATMAGVLEQMASWFYATPGLPEAYMATAQHIKDLIQYSPGPSFGGGADPYTFKLKLTQFLEKWMEQRNLKYYYKDPLLMTAAELADFGRKKNWGFAPVHPAEERIADTGSKHDIIDTIVRVYGKVVNQLGGPKRKGTCGMP